MKGQVDLFAAKGMPTSLTTAPVPFQRLVKHLSQYKGRTEELKVRHYYLCVSLCDLSHPSPFVSQLVLAYFTFRIFLYSFVFWWFIVLRLLNLINHYLGCWPTDNCCYTRDCWRSGLPCLQRGGGAAQTPYSSACSPAFPATTSRDSSTSSAPCQIWWQTR